MELLFNAPKYLWMLPISILPVLFHLYSKRNYQTINWGATRFLTAAYEKHHVKLKISQLMILLLRVLMIMILILLLADPYIKFSKSISFSSNTQQIHHVLLLDVSLSMGTENLSRAKKEITEYLEKSIDHEVVTVLLVGEHVEFLHAVDRPQKLDLIQRLKEVELLGQELNLPKAIELSTDYLQQIGAAYVQLSIFSDSQAVSRSQIDSLDAAQKRMKKTLPNVKIYVKVFPFIPSSNNVQVRGITFEQNIFKTKKSYPAKVTLNYSGKFSREYSLNVYLATKLLYSEKVLVQPGLQEVNILVRFQKEGEQRLKIEITGDNYIADNTLYKVLQVDEQVNVLYLLATTRENRNVAVLKKALLTPQSFGEKSFFTFTEIELKNLRTKRRSYFDNFQVIILDQWELLNTIDVLNLERFVREGGGVWILPPYDNFAQLAGQQSIKNLLPGKWNGESINLNNPGNFSLGKRPILWLESLVLGKSNTLDGIEVQRFYKFTPYQSSNVLLKVNDNPLWIIGRLDRGYTALTLTSLDASWGNFIQGNLFLPFVQRLVAYLGQKSKPIDNLISGEVADVRIPFSKGWRPNVRFGQTFSKSKDLPIRRHSRMWVGQSLPSNDTGFYYIFDKNKSILKTYAVNIDFNELDDVSGQLNRWLAGQKESGVYAIPISESMSQPSAWGESIYLWNWLLIIFIGIMLTELKLSTRRKTL
ncbi:MAG: BatA domain-containing protein [Lentisphaeria bacterium]|nr:BatA domain-containing protein [Lentisphaeria bacterium]